LKTSAFYKSVILLFLATSIFSCQSKHEKRSDEIILMEAVTLLGDTLVYKVMDQGAAMKKYDSAKASFEKDHKYDKAIADFEKAVELIEGTEDQVEPDGLPNERNIPLSTLHGNIWYHLGLAYYLQNDMENALKAYSNRTVTEKYPDNLVSGGYWLYMINRRLGNTDAANVAIDGVTAQMDIIENMSYHKMCLFYKGLIPLDSITNKGIGTSSSDVLSYGLGNWYLYEKNDTLKAKELYEHLLEKGNKYSFAYLAAESDYKRLFVKDKISRD